MGSEVIRRWHILFVYSAQWAKDYVFYISVATSTNPVGPFFEYSDISVMEPLIQFEKHLNEIPRTTFRPCWTYRRKRLYKSIDGSPFVDPLTGKSTYI